jgi:hypothetical protein
VRVALWYTTGTAAALAVTFVGASFLTAISGREWFVQSLDALASLAQRGWLNVAALAAACAVLLVLLRYLLLTLFNTLPTRGR